MGVFDWLRRGSSTKAATEAAPAESASTAPEETPEESAKSAESADQVGIPKQQSADKAADSETGEGARN
ncbi:MULTISPECIES: gliding motility protein [Streptomyces]|uniref:Gliding motility protein n=1 Tax=Streptomyces silvisoli TaxID=3034235 RepID=A0ABT5ZRR6_9ACTN|nr:MULTISPECIES: gliding motility protein [Streptomyces]MDF3292326.1 gliding motility protein [Streptomyces silvisoli]